ncbi:MAG: energy transducer TonB [Acidobacteriota bacterium]|nr:MAG: energy transducer TonB [Acidobacteriota bacterium]
MFEKPLFHLILAILVLGLPILAQDKAASTRKAVKKPIISAGIVNGRAKELVVPEWPPAAKSTNDHGLVRVEVVIDQDGKVEDAKALEGPVLLRRTSVAAAKESTFYPILLQGKPVRVLGLIIYRYIPYHYNWLEIGFSEPGQIQWSRLPEGVEQLGEMRNVRRSEIWGDNPQEEAALIAAVESALVSDYKKLWLFRVGRSLNKIGLQYKRNEETLARVGAELERLLITKPEDASVALLRKLETIAMLIRTPDLNTVDPIRGSRLNQEMTEITYMASVYGR